MNCETIEGKKHMVEQQLRVKKSGKNEYNESEKD